MSLGLQKAGIEILSAYEWWDKAIATYNLNITGNKAAKQDLQDETIAINNIIRLKPDIIVGGPPCQDFSSAGFQIEGTRASLTVSFANIVAGTNPAVFAMENVPNAKHSEAYKKATHIFTQAGYHLTESIIDAAYFDVPQHRKRLVLIGNRHDNFNVRNALELEETILPTTVKQKYPDFPVDFYYRHPRSYMRRAIFSIDEPAPTVRGVNRPRPKQYRINPNDATDQPDVRALTYSERALLQTFPADYKWGNFCKSDIEQMIGNAVPVDMAHHIGNVLYAMAMRSQVNRISFSEWLRTEKGDTEASASNILSRLRRAVLLSPEHSLAAVRRSEFHKTLSNANISSTAKAGIKRAIALYECYSAYSAMKNNATE